MPRIWQTIVVATTGAALTLAAIDANPAHALKFKSNFTVDITTGDLAGNSYEGYLTFEDSELTGTGNETVVADKVSFDFNGLTYTEKQDFYYPSAPFVEFDSGTFLGLNFSPFDDFFALPFDLINDSLEYFAHNSGEVAVSSLGGGVGSVTYTEPEAVPEPATILGLSVIGLGFLLRKKQVSSQNI
ncbi:MAG: PEP-CTERM sorting domain-containing protein [Symploca sp. SIO1C4]|uniref:PEP-CTERM sorting domain-containing protein n=1 Tax=Symploca sp. SIO1C4 TaxID=2607765 RepID=A0A6B3NIW8_9CYAN|nr:PEP-CTERM sorting domain-containing protein [Symploca sp. SIO1C4]